MKIKQTLPANRHSGFLSILLGLALAAGLGIAIIGTIAMTLLYPNLPPLDVITDYNPKVPMRIFSADGEVIGEFGEERRNVVRIEEVPVTLKQAILAAEDDRFYQHGGVDYAGILRAVVTNLTSGVKSQGGSTITMQVARNFFLTKEKTYTRKLYELLMSFKIEANLSKDQILELYINQIYLGQRAYGFASAARIYFGKSLKDITVAEAAMLAGLPKAPSAYNPVVNPKRAYARQQYILRRMNDLGYIDDATKQTASAEELRVKASASEFAVHAEYVAETARQMAYELLKEDAYTRGINVYTTIQKSDQAAAYAALRKGILEYEKRQVFRGPEGFVELKGSLEDRLEQIDDALLEHPDTDELWAAVVLEASPKTVKVARSRNEIITMSGESIKLPSSWLASNAPANKKLLPGAIIRITKLSETRFDIVQMPEVESAFVSLNTQTGAIQSLVGGFDFQRNKFNHVTQAQRQPGSSFKPFIYSAALEKGFSPSSLINDAPVHFDAPAGGQAWDPKNYDGKYEGPMKLRTALAKSKNMVSIRILEKIGPKYAQNWVSRFGFEADKHPAYLTMALGAGTVNPLEMARGYAVFANGGFRVNPYLVEKITDAKGNILAQANPVKAGDENIRAIDDRNAFLMDSLMREVVRSGTAARALSLGRSDLAGKTGTTNDSHDAWFAGYSPNLVGVAWVGYDQPKKLGDRETGGGLALPIWIDYMSQALRRYPETAKPVPEGVIQTDNDYFFVEYQSGQHVTNVGGTDFPVSKN
jgi:penicillin-binding protein 1A